MAEKLPPPQPAFNRPSTQQRPVDKQRFQSIDMVSEAAAADPEYQRMMRDIEAMQHGQGWLRGSGAFDKEDLLYLRDKETQQHQAELEQRSLEAAAYAAARACAEREQQEAEHATLMQQAKAAAVAAGGFSSSTGGASSSRLPQTAKVPAPLQPVVKVKQRYGKQGSSAGSAAGPAAAEVEAAMAAAVGGAEEPAAKRQRLDGGTAADPGQQRQQQALEGGVGSAGSEQAAAVQQPAAAGQAEQPQADGRSPPLHAAVAADPGKAGSGLDALLGAYCSSDSDGDSSEDTSEEGAATRVCGGLTGAAAAGGAGGAGGAGRTLLPSALELLEQDIIGSGSFAEQHRQQQQQQQEGGDKAGSKAAGVLRNYQQQSGWI